jgi:hypothetical protein
MRSEFHPSKARHIQRKHFSTVDHMPSFFSQDCSQPQLQPHPAARPVPEPKRLPTLAHEERPFRPCLRKVQLRPREANLKRDEIIWRSASNHFFKHHPGLAQSAACRHSRLMKLYLALHR